MINAPSSKAHTLRALIISSLAKGTSIVHAPLLGEDQLNVIEALKGLGVTIKLDKNKLIVNGVSGRYSPGVDRINIGESGVGMNFLIAAACLTDKPIIITGARRIKERPIADVVNGLRQLGGEIEYLATEGFPPVKVHPGGISGGQAEIEGKKTSQYFSAIAISAPYARENVILKCIDDMSEKPYFDITLQMMSKFGVEAENRGYKEIRISAKTRYHSREISMEGDYSSASFFFLAAAISGTKVTVSGLRPDTAQGDTEFLTLLKKMGCIISVYDNKICVEGKPLQAIQKDMKDIPDLVPPIAVAAAFAEGTSRFTNIGHLRHKECDRLAVICSELEKMGVFAKCDQSALVIEGTNNIHGAQIDPHNDHRIAMSFATAGLAVGNQTIENEQCVAKSFPDFWDTFQVFYNT